MQTCQHTVGVIDDTFDASQYGLYRVDTALSTALHDCHHQQQASLCQLSSSQLLDKLLSSDVSCGPASSQGCFQRHQSAALASAALQVRGPAAPGTCSGSRAQHKSLANSHVPLHAAASGGFAKRPGPAVLHPSHSFDADAFAAATEAAEAVAAAAVAAATTSASPAPLLLPCASLTGSGTPTLGIFPTTQLLTGRGSSSSSSSWCRITPSGQLPGGEDAAATPAAGPRASSCSEPPAAVAPQLPWTTEQRLKPAPNPARVVEETAEWHCPEAGNSSGPESAVGAPSALLQVATAPPAARPSARKLQTTQPEPPTCSLFTALEAVGVSAVGFPPAMLEMHPELDILDLAASILDIPDQQQQQQQLQWSNSLMPRSILSGLYQETGGKAVRAATHVSAAAPKQRMHQQRVECPFSTDTTAAAATLAPAGSGENTVSVLSTRVNYQPAWAHPLPNNKNNSDILLTPGSGHDATAGSTAEVAAVTNGQQPEYELKTFTPGPDGKLLQAEPDAALKPLAVGPSMQKPVSNSTSRKRLPELSSSPSICHHASKHRCKGKDNGKDRDKAEKERDKQKKSQEQVQVLEQQLAEAMATKTAMRGQLDAMIRDKASLLEKMADFTSHLQEVVAENAALSSHNATLQQLLAAVGAGGGGGTGLYAAGNATAGSFSHGHAIRHQSSLQNPSHGAVQALHVGQQHLSLLDRALLLPLVGAPGYGRPADAVTATVAAGSCSEECRLPGTSCHQVVSGLYQRQLHLQQQSYDLAARNHRRRFALL